MESNKRGVLMAQEKVPNKTQQVRAMLANPNSVEIRELLKSPSQMGALTLPAITELADGLVSAGRWDDIALAFKLGHEKVFSSWLDSSGYGEGKRCISKHIAIDEARKHFSNPETKKLLDKVVEDLVCRTQEGQWDVWNAMRGDAAYEAELFTPRIAKGLSLKLLLEAQYQSESTPMPADLKNKAVAAAVSTEYWNFANYEPIITSWGSISKRQSNWRAGTIHEMFMAGEYEAATEATRLLGIDEYGKSGRGPIDSALMSGWFEAVEGLAKQDPLSLIRPVKVAANECGWIDEHIPLKSFMADVSNSSAGKNYGLRIREAQDGSPSYFNLEDIMDKWVGGAYALVGTEAQKQQWDQEWSRFQKAAENETSKLRLFDALTVFKGMIDDAVERLGITPKNTASFRAWMATPAYEKIINGRQSPIAERIKRDAFESRKQADQRVLKLAGLPSTEATPENTSQRTEHSDGFIATNAHRPDASTLIPAITIESPSQHFNASNAVSPGNGKIGIAIKLKTKRQTASGYDKEQTAALGRAVSQCDPTATRRALEAGADPNGRVGTTDSMLHRALSLPKPEKSKIISEMLIAAGADPEMPDGKGRLPFDKGSSAIGHKI